jgi:hypothetical protein
MTRAVGGGSVPKSDKSDDFDKFVKFDSVQTLDALNLDGNLLVVGAKGGNMGSKSDKSNKSDKMDTTLLVGGWNVVCIRLNPVVVE